MKIIKGLLFSTLVLGTLLFCKPVKATLLDVHYEIKVFDSQSNALDFCLVNSCGATTVLVGDLPQLYYAVDYLVARELGIMHENTVLNLSAEDLFRKCEYWYCLSISQEGYNNYSLTIAGTDFVDPEPKDPPKGIDPDN